MPAPKHGVVVVVGTSVGTGTGSDEHGSERALYAGIRV
jgi:hypothetical protein